MCGVTASYSILAASIAGYASDKSTDHLLWQAAVAIIGIFMVAMSLVVTIAWGGTFASHSLSAIGYAIPAFLLLITSSVTIHRAKNVDHYVSSNWDDLSAIVPAHFSALPWTKYAVASYTPMMLSGMTGFVTSLLLGIGFFYHFRCGSIMLSVGPDLYIAKSNLQKQYADLITQSRGAKARPVVDRGVSFFSGVVGAYDDKADDYGFDDDHTYNAAGKSTTGLLDSRGNGGYGAITETSSIPPQVLSHEPIRLTEREKSEMRLPARIAMPLIDETADFDEDRQEGGAPMTPHERAVANAKRRVAAVQQAKYLAILYNRTLTDLQKRVRTPSCRSFWRSFCFDFRQLWGAFRPCFLIFFIGLAIAVTGLGAGLGKVAGLAECSALAVNPPTTTLEHSFVIASSKFNRKFGRMNIFHDYPFGEVIVDDSHVETEDNDGKVTVRLTAFAAKEKDLPSEEYLLSTIILDDYLDPTDEDTDDADDDEYDPGGYMTFNLTLAAPPDALKKCIGIRATIVTKTGLLSLEIHSVFASVFVYGNAKDLDSNSFAPYAFQEITVRTDDAPVTLTNAFVDRFAMGQPEEIVPAIQINSNSGDVYLENIYSPGVHVDTAGNIRSIGVASLSFLNCVGVCGDITYNARDNGRIVVAKIFGANNAYLSTNKGDIVSANTGIGIARDTYMISDSGKVYLSNFIQLFGNRTIVRTSNDVSASAAFVNVLDIEVTKAASVSLVACFVGSEAPTEGFYPPVTDDYSPPLIRVYTATGSISALGVGGNPGDAAYANVTSVDFFSRTGSIKLEANGGGVNADYEVSSAIGRAVVEIDGEMAPLTGTLGTGSDKGNYVRLHSGRNSVQLTLLPSPY